MMTTMTPTNASSEVEADNDDGVLINEELLNGICSSSTTFRVVSVILPFVQLIGLVGNALSFRLLSKRALKCHSARVYLRTLALFDSFVLINFFLDWGMHVG